MALSVCRRAVLAALPAGVTFLLQGCIKKPPPSCSAEGFNCMETGCCVDKTRKCYARDETWASCKASCESSFATECRLVSPGGKIAPPASTSPPPTTTTKPKNDYADVKWITGTWTTGYWDCCKPSCAWPGKGKLDNPVASCDGRTGKKLDSARVKSVCEKRDAGHAVTCTNQQPFKVNPGLSYGFVAATVTGKHGLDGDGVCGQCYELLFTDQQHVDKGTGDKWGGAHPDVVDKRMIVQVTNIGFDVVGNHSFDIMIPGAGQGIFSGGCHAQFPSHAVDDFDCGNRHGGCSRKSGCAKLPAELRPGCEWRHDWYRWLAGGGRTNNPFIKFRRVQCPMKIVERSGTSPSDDSWMPAASLSETVILS